MDSTTPFQPWATDDSDKNVKTERDLVDDAKLHRENVNPKHTQTASYDKESVSIPNSIPGSSEGTASTRGPSLERDSKMDATKVASMQQIVENTLSQEGIQRVAQLLEAVEVLSGAERLLLYLRLPTGVTPHDPLKQPVNPLGSRAELQQTVTWIQTHLEVDPDVSLPKQDVYDEYIAHCMSSNMKPLSTADFGKVMKQVYPTVRPRRLGTRGNSRYCYAGLRKKIKLEVPQLPDLGDSSKEIAVTSRETERIVCDWAETKLGVKLSSISELSRHLSSSAVPPGPASVSPPHVPPHVSPHVPPHAPPNVQPHAEDPSNRQLMKHLKRKIQTQATPSRPKKNKSQEARLGAGGGDSIGVEAVTCGPYSPHAAPLKHEGGGGGGTAADVYYAPYVPAYEGRAPYPAYPPRAHPHHGDYRADPYVFEPPYAPRDLSVPLSHPHPLEPVHNLPINLSSDASLDLSTERADWQRRRPPEPPPPLPPRLTLPGKKLILETYQSETQASSPRSTQTEVRSTQHVSEEFPRTEYLPKKMRAAEIMGGKLAAARLALAHAETPSTSATHSAAETPTRSEVAFLEDPKNLMNRSKSTAAALAREEQKAASPTQAVKAPAPRPAGRPRRTAATLDSCCGLDGINIKTGMICEEKHSEILNRERVISICNIDKHDLDDYLNEGNSQEHEEELLKYFHQRDSESDARGNTSNQVSFLEAGQDPQDDHSQGKNEKLTQLRELLAKNLKNQCGSNSQNQQTFHETLIPSNNCLDSHSSIKPAISEGAFKPVVTETVNGPTTISNQNEISNSKHCNSIPTENGTQLAYVNQNVNQLAGNIGGSTIYNGNGHNEPQSPTTRTQQYDFVPISDGCHSPANFNSKSPVGFGQTSHSPKVNNKPVLIGGSLQTSPISHSTAASPFVSPRNTPVPRSRQCTRPIPKVNGRKRRQALPLGISEACPKPFVMPNDQHFISKSVCGPGTKYCQPMSAPPSPNIISQYKNQIFHSTGIPNGISNMCLNFMPNTGFRENINGDLAHPLSADPLSSEVSQFFQESIVNYKPGHDNSFRSQSVPLKPGMNTMGLLSYTNTPVGSVPPTPIPNEFCDFGTLADTCDISKAGLNPETLDKIYDAIDSSHDVLSTAGSQSLLNTNGTLSNGCESMSDQNILTDGQLNSYIPNDNDLLERSNQFNQTFSNDANSTEDVVEFLKRTDSIEFDLSEYNITEKNKYYTSRSVPSTPLPFKRAVPNLQIDSRRSRELFTPESYTNVSNGISSKSVPSTPQLSEDRSVFSYSNRDFLINGNSVEICGGSQLHEAVVDNDQGLASPLHDMLREDILDPLTPAADLLADLDKIDGTPYVDL